MADCIGAEIPSDLRHRTPYLGTTMVHSTGAGYDAFVAGLDEVSARSALAAMQDRLARDPMSALGLGTNATLGEVRAAFLQLTKQYHPVRFGRMALDIQKLSNEVFLALRAAHDALAKGLRSTGPIAQARGPTPSALGSQVLPPTLHPASHPALHPASHPASHPAVSPGTRPPALSVKPARTSNDSGERPAIVARALTPPMGVRVPASRPPVVPPPLPRPPAPLGAGSPVTPASSGRPPQAPASPPAVAPVAGPKDEAAALDLLHRQHWDQARSVLHQLSARDPGSKRIRALMCYARGREAQLDRRLDDARVELQDALDLDPDLQLAKTALTELFTRRK
jgi:hypothetical protein